jgi:hypothetical protein
MAERAYAFLCCDACGRPVDSDNASSGLLVFVRQGSNGERESRYEQPPLCASCSMAIGVTALVRWAEEEEEG